MILVTGAGRCGSSLMMQTLNLLGFPLYGEPGDYNSITDHDKEESKRVNPKGFYEIPVEDIIKLLETGFDETSKGKAIKILGSIGWLLDPKDIEKAILCLRRDREAQAISLHNLANLELSMQKKYKDNRLSKYLTMYKGKSVRDVKTLQDDTLRLLHDVLSHTNHIVVYFEDILSNPHHEIQRVADFLEIDTPIDKAVDNVIQR